MSGFLLLVASNRVQRLRIIGRSKDVIELGARAGAREGVADLLPQPRDEDDVRVEAQWQEHVCRSNLGSGVSARIEGRELAFWHAIGAWPWGQGFGGVRSSAVVSHCITYVETTTGKTPSGRQCPGGIP